MPRIRQSEVNRVIQEVWALFPQLRLTQLMSNAATMFGWIGQDLYAMTDEQLVEALRQYATVYGRRP